MKLSKRAEFKKLLQADILAVLDVNRCMRVSDLKTELLDSKSNRYYVNNVSGTGVAYTTWADRFYRNLASVQGAVTFESVKVQNGFVVKKHKGKLFAISNNKFWQDVIRTQGMTDWTANYNGTAKV